MAARAEAKADIKPRDRCGPASVKTTAEGEGNTPQEAVSAAASAARGFADALCHGKCDPTSTACAYTEGESVVASPPTKIPGTNPVRYRAEVTSSGKCECQV